MTKLVLYFALTLLVNFSHQENEVATSNRFGEFNIYNVFTRDNPREPQRIEATAASVASFRNFRTHTVIIVHGHEGSGSTTLNPTLKDAFLSSEDISVIVVDWSLVAAQSYTNAVAAVPSVGAGLAVLIRWLLQYNRVNLARLHLVGFDLGAHVVAFAARATNGVVARITALDPARNQWGSNTQRLTQSDAAYVEVIHTDSGSEATANGIGEAIGHIDFFPNTGTNQPGCGTDNECNHKRAWELFAATLTHNNIIGNQCDEDAEPAEANCHGYTVPMGNNDMIKYGSGVFYVGTGRTYPYNVPLNCLLPCIVG